MAHPILILVVAFWAAVHLFDRYYGRPPGDWGSQDESWPFGDRDRPE